MTIALGIAILAIGILATIAVMCLKGAWKQINGKEWQTDTTEALFLLGFAAAAVIGILGVISLYRQETGETFELLKSQWSCTASHEETGVTPTQIGETTVMIPNTSTVCDRYDRR